MAVSEGGDASLCRHRGVAGRGRMASWQSHQSRRSRLLCRPRGRGPSSRQGRRRRDAAQGARAGPLGPEPGPGPIVPATIF